MAQTPDDATPADTSAGGAPADPPAAAERTVKKAAAKKTAATKAAAKKAVAKKAAVKKAPATKAAAEKATAKKAPAKKTATEKTTAQRTPATKKAVTAAGATAISAPATPRKDTAPVSGDESVAASGSGVRLEKPDTEPAPAQGRPGLVGRARSLDRAVLLPALVAVIALVIGDYLVVGWLVPDPKPAASAADTSKPSAAPSVDTRLVVNQAGGYSVRVPQGMTAQRSGTSTRLVNADKTLAVTVAPTLESEPAALTNARVIKAMQGTYAAVRLVTNERQQIDRLPAVASYGTATTKQKVSLRFALVTVAGPKVNYAISTFAAADADPEKVLPQVRAIANGFRLLR